MLPIERYRPLLEPVIVNVTGTKSPWEIFVQTQKSGGEADKITEALEATLKEETVLITNPTANMYCAAKYEHNWYRAKIVKVDDESAQVHYIDFGNQELVAFNDICALPQAFLQQVPQCFRIKVGNSKPLRNTWSLKAIKFTEDTLRDKLCEIVSLRKDEDEIKENSLKPTVCNILIIDEEEIPMDFSDKLLAAKLGTSLA